MLGKYIVRKFIALTTIAAIWCVYSMVAFAVPVDMAGEITVTGQVTVDGQTAVSNSTIISGATITTGSGSSAIVSLGKTGRIEILADSNLTLRFTATSIVAILSEGKTRVSNAAGVATTVATRNATVIADAGQADNFLVEVECSHTHLDTTSGLVTLREGSNDKQVVAGTSAVAGNLVQTGCKPCLRPSSTPGPAIAGFPWLILLAAAGAGAGIYFGNQGGDIPIGGGTVVVSPVR